MAKIKKVLISEEEIIKKCAEIGEAITKDYKGKKPILVALLKGSVPFMAELMKRIDNNKLETQYMIVSSYASGITSSGQIKIVKDLDVSIENRDVILVEDIIDSGLTLATIAEMLRHRNPSSIEIACLLDKKTKRKTEVDVKYIGFEIPDEFVIGFGLDYDEHFRNLPYIGVLDTTTLKED